jgi:hypothetical protein
MVPPLSFEFFAESEVKTEFIHSGLIEDSHPFSQIEKFLLAEYFIKELLDSRKTLIFNHIKSYKNLCENLAQFWTNSHEQDNFVL